MPSRSTAGFAIFETIFALLFLIALGLVGYLILHDSHGSTQASPPASATKPAAASQTTSNAYAVLSPATVPPKAAECTTPITFASNGNSGPIQCPNGDLNATEWNALSALEPSVMSLGYSATAAQVQSALCTDANASNSDANTKNSSVVEATVYQISALYYGWSFSTNPTSVLSGSGC